MVSDKDKEELAKRLKIARTINGNLKLSAVAELIGSTKSALSLYESGKRVPRQDVLEKLAATYKVPLEYLKDGIIRVHSNPKETRTEFIFGADGIKEISMEEYEMSHKLIIETAKQKMLEKIEKLEPEELRTLINLTENDLRGISRMFKSRSLLSSLMLHADLPERDLDELANFIYDYELPG